MIKRFPNLRILLSSITFLSGSILSVNAGFKEAQQLYENKDFVKAFPQIEKELADDKASVEVLTLGSKIAWESGHTITAAKAITKLLSKEKKPSAEVYFLAGQIAESMGDFGLAATRYSRYAEMADSSDKNLKRTLRFILHHNPGAQEFALWDKYYRKDPSTFYMGLNIYDRLLSVNRVDDALKVMGTVLAGFKNKSQAQILDDKIQHTINSSYIINDDQRYALIRSMKANPEIVKTHSSRRILETFGGETAALNRISSIFILHQESEVIHGGVLSFIRDLNQVKNDNLKKSFLEKYLALGKKYRAAKDPDALAAYLINLLDGSAVDELKKNNLYSEGEENMALLADLFKDSPEKVIHWFNLYSDRYLDNTKKPAFLNKYLKYVDTNRLNELCALNQYKNVDSYINRWKSSRSYRDNMFSSRAFADIYLRAGEMDKALAALDTAYRLEGFIDFNSFLDNGSVDQNKLSGIILKWIEDGGESQAIRHHVSKLKNWGKEKGPAIIDAFKKSKGKAGKDSLLTAITTYFIKRGDRGNPDLDKAVEKALSEIKEQYSMKSEDVKDLKHLQIHRLCDLHANSSQHNRKAMAGVVKQWLPLIKVPGDASDFMFRRYGENNFRFEDHSKDLLRFFSEYDPKNPHLAHLFTWIRLPGKTKEDPFARFQDKIGEPYYTYLIHNRDALDREAFAPELMKAFIPVLKSAEDIRGVEGGFNELSRRIPQTGISTQMIVDITKGYLDFEKRMNTFNPGMVGHFLNMCAAGGKSDAYPQIYPLFMNHLKGVSNDFTYYYQERFSKDSRRFDREFLKEFSSDYFKTVTAANPMELEDRVLTWDWSEYVLNEGIVKDIYPMFERGVTSENHLVMEHIIKKALLPKIESGSYKPAGLRRVLENYGRGYRADGRTWKNDIPVTVQALEKAGEYELAYCLVDYLHSGHHHKNEIATTVNVLKGRLSRHVPGLMPVEKGHPHYNIYLAQQAINQKSTGLAWELLAPSLNTYMKSWETFGVEVALFVADRLRNTKRFDEAKLFCQTILLKESSFDAKSMGLVNLIKADIYRDTQNFQAARVSYKELVNNSRYKGIEAAREAKLRLIDLLILTKDAASAEMEAQRLIDSNDVMDQAEGYYYLAQVSAMGKEYEQANEYLKDVFKRNSSHNKAKLLKGEMRFHIRAGLSSTEIDMGTTQRQQVAVPGRELVLKLQDANLAIARAGQSIPVIVTTSVGKDKERVQLMVDQEDPTLFKGIINTTLGKVTPGNVQLELTGEDIISYLIDPDFQKANALDYGSKELIVKSSARLIASSGEILSPKEQEERELAMKLRDLSGTSAKERGRNSQTIRPGSPIHVQVTDFDQDLSDKPDTAYVTIMTNTGDILENWELIETGSHTGIFKSMIPTGSPAPMARASDTQEGTDAYGPININRKDSWESVRDGKFPKWYEIDTMSSYSISEAKIKVDNAASVKSVSLVGYLGENKIILGQWPETTNSGKGGLNVSMRWGHRGRSQRELALFLNQQIHKETWIPTLEYVGRRDLKRERNEDRTLAFEGTFWVEEGKNFDFKLLHKASPNHWQSAYLLIDDNILLGGTITEEMIDRVFSTYLEQGPHQLKMYMFDHWAESSFSLGYKNANGEFVPVPADWFSPEKNPKLADFIKPKAKIEKNADGFAAKIKTDKRIRSVRWIFENFTSSSIKISEAEVKDAEGRTIIPVKSDFTTGRTNKVLEVAPGDDIEVVYNDKKRLDDDPPKLQKQLNATYFNANISLNFEKVKEDRHGHIHSTLFKAKRIAEGDQLLIRVEDWDQDQGEKQDMVNVTVKTSSGESLVVKLIEEKSHHNREVAFTGVFRQILTLGTVTKGTSIKVVPGDKITVSYVDNENTDPGVPTNREYSVNFIKNEAASFNFLLSSTERVEDRSPRAMNKIKLLRQRGDKRENIKIYKSQINAEPVKKLETANLQVPLVFNLFYPAGARHAGSIATVEVLTSSEIETAKKENREPVAVSMSLRLQKLSDLARQKGYDIRILTAEPNESQLLQTAMFAGLLRFQLGSPGDEPDTSIRRDSSDSMVLQSSAALQQVNPEEKDQFIVPTVIVKGSDKVILRLKNEKGAVISEESFALASDGEIGLFDPQMVSERPNIHLGQSFQVKLNDADRDVSDELDEVTIDINVKSGQKMSWILKETLPHSGIFTTRIKPEFKSSKLKKAEGADTKQEAKNLMVEFGDSLQFTYNDVKTVRGSKLSASTTGLIHNGSDGKLVGFSKKFQDPEIAVQTQFLIAEAMFEMAKDHRKLKKEELASEEIATGKRILEEALRDYPNTKLKAQGEYLLANLAQELEKYEEAIGRYSAVISAYPKSEFAPKSQFKKALCLEKLNQHDNAMEEYVKLTYLYPTNELVSDATVRLGNFYYVSKEYKTAARIFEKFQDKHPDHALGIKALFLAGQAHIKRENYEETIRVLDKLIEAYPDETVIRPEAMYWKGDSLFKLKNFVGAYRVFKKLTWDYPSSKFAKIARGRLADKTFTAIEENQ